MCLYVNISHKVKENQPTIYQYREIGFRGGDRGDRWIFLERRNRIYFMGRVLVNGRTGTGSGEESSNVYL